MRSREPESLSALLPGLVALPTRAEREAAAAREAAEARARLLATIGETVRDVAGEDASRQAVAGLERRAAVQEAAPVEQSRVRCTLGPVGPRWDEQPDPAALPQAAKPPPHLPYNAPAEERASRLGRARAGVEGKRETEAAWWPAWARTLAERICAEPRRALAELQCVPRWAADSMYKEARPYGGVHTVAGRNVLALALVLWHVSTRLKGRISGLPRGAYTSLTCGPNGRSYSDAAVWHPVHDAEGDLEPDARGPRGGRIGAGRNCGLMYAITRAGWLRTHVPPVSQIPSWMASATGWPLVQVLVSHADPAPPAS